MNRLIIKNTPIEGLKVIQRLPVGDQRGYLERIFCLEELNTLMGNRFISQINHTLTVKAGTIRGMHFQKPPNAEMKFVSCLKGEVFDVAVDLRTNSPTFLNWFSEVLTESNHKTLLIPEGFAHGFQTLTDNCELIYLHTANYSPESEAGLNALDPKLSIKWPLTISELSARDQKHTMIPLNFSGLSI